MQTKVFPVQKVSWCLIPVLVCAMVLLLFYYTLQQDPQQQRHQQQAIIKKSTTSGAFDIFLKLMKGDFPFTPLRDTANKSFSQFWNSFNPPFICPNASLLRLGKLGDGGKWTCGVENLSRLKHVRNPCVVYSFGVSGDSSFEADVLSSTHCDVWAYDPTVDKIATPLRPTNPRVHFSKLGISGTDKAVSKTLLTLMTANGHGWIDLLKMDIEESEYPVLENILSTFESLPFGQLLVEFHAGWNGGKTHTQSIVNRLEKKGMRLFHVEINSYYAPGCEFSLINTKSLELFLQIEEIRDIAGNVVPAKENV